MFCAKCGNELSDEDRFCGKCGTAIAGKPVFPDIAYANPPNRKLNRSAVVLISVGIITALTIFIVVIIAAAGHSLSGKYGHSQRSDGSYGYVIEFRSGGKCLWSQSGSVFSGTYEYSDDEYIIRIEGNGLYLTTIFRAKKTDSDTLRISGGIFTNADFTRFQEE